jgi:hypothetical protein
VPADGEATLTAMPERSKPAETDAPTGARKLAPKQAPGRRASSQRSTVAARARAVKRRLLRRHGLRASELDAPTAELVDVYSRLKARCELLDAADAGADGAADKVLAWHNACARALRSLTLRLDGLGADPERRLAVALDELADELAEDDGEAEAEDGEADDEPDATRPIVRGLKPASRAAFRPAANGAQTAERLDDGPAVELEAEAEPPSPPWVGNARLDRPGERGAPSSGPDNPDEGEGGYPLRDDRNTATVLREKVVTLARRLDPRHVELPELPKPAPREITRSFGSVTYTHTLDPPTKRSERLTEAAYRALKVAQGTPRGVAALLALVARRSGEVDADGDGDARAGLGVPETWHGPEVEPAPPGEPLRRGQPMPMPREYRGAGRTAVPWAIW